MHFVNVEALHFCVTIYCVVFNESIFSIKMFSTSPGVNSGHQIHESVPHYIGPSPLLQRRHVKTPSAGQDGASHLVDEDVERRLQRGSVPAAHREEAEAHPHVEPLADSAAPEQTRGLGLALRAPACTGDGDEHAEHELSRTCCVK